MKHAISLGVTVAAAPLLAACPASLSVTDDRPQSVTISTVHERQAEVVRLFQSCPISDRPAPGESFPAVAPLIAVGIASAFIPILIDFGVDIVSDYLTRIEKEKTGNFLATGSGDLLKEGTGCLVIARGRIGTLSSTLPPQGSIDAETLRQVGLVAPPDFYLEVRVSVMKRSSQQLAKSAQAETAADLILRPQLLHFARTAALRETNEAKAIGLVLVLRSTTVPEGVDQKTASMDAEAVFPISFGKVRPGTEIRPVVFPPPAAPDKQEISHPFSDLVRSMPIPRLPTVLNMYAFVTEAGEPERVLTLLNETVAGKKDTLGTALSTVLQDALKKDQKENSIK